MCATKRLSWRTTINHGNRSFCREVRRRRVQPHDIMPPGWTGLFPEGSFTSPPAPVSPRYFTADSSSSPGLRFASSIVWAFPPPSAATVGFNGAHFESGSYAPRSTSSPSVHSQPTTPPPGWRALAFTFHFRKGASFARGERWQAQPGIFRWWCQHDTRGSKGETDERWERIPGAHVLRVHNTCAITYHTDHYSLRLLPRASLRLIVVVIRSPSRVFGYFMDQVYSCLAAFTCL